jgi:hypothetical protein
LILHERRAKKGLAVTSVLKWCRQVIFLDEAPLGRFKGELDHSLEPFHLINVLVSVRRRW